MKKMKNYLKPGILLLGISLLLWNCEKQDSFQQQNIIETVSIDEAVNFFNLEKSSVFAKSYNENYITPDLDKISHEKILNSNELLTVIPAITKYENLYTRILLLKINKEIKSVVLNMYPNSESKNRLFSGEITIVSLEGVMLRAFKIQDGVVIKLYDSKSSNISNKSYRNKSTTDDSECRQLCGHEASDPNCMCNTQLDEVVITTKMSYLRIVDLYDIGGGDNTSPCEINCEGWDFW